MREFLEFVAAQLLDRPEDLVVRQDSRGDLRSYVLELPRSEVGKVIGKQGHTIRAIRRLLAAASARTGERMTLEIVEQPDLAV